MHVLIGAALAVAMLVLWASGHWSGRIVMFLALTVIGAYVSMAYAVAHETSHWPGHIIVLFAAWILSGVPKYYGRLSSRRF